MVVTASHPMCSRIRRSGVPPIRNQDCGGRCAVPRTAWPWLVPLANARLGVSLEENFEVSSARPQKCCSCNCLIRLGLTGIATPSGTYLSSTMTLVVRQSVDVDLGRSVRRTRAADAEAGGIDYADVIAKALQPHGRAFARQLLPPHG